MNQRQIYRQVWKNLFSGLTHRDNSGDMNYFKSWRFDIILLVFITFCIIFTYWNLPNTFFQQDEWYGFNIYNQREGLDVFNFIKEVFFTFGKTHYTPLAEL